MPLMNRLLICASLQQARAAADRRVKIAAMGGVAKATLPPDVQDKLLQAAETVAAPFPSSGTTTLDVDSCNLLLQVLAVFSSEESRNQALREMDQIWNRNAASFDLLIDFLLSLMKSTKESTPSTVAENGLAQLAGAMADAAAPHSDEKKRDLEISNQVINNTKILLHEEVVAAAEHTLFLSKLKMLLKAISPREANLLDPNINPIWAEIFEKVCYLPTIVAIRQGLNAHDDLTRVLPPLSDRHAVMRDAFMPYFLHYVIMALAISKEGGAELAAPQLRVPYALFYIAFLTHESSLGSLQKRHFETRDAGLNVQPRRSCAEGSQGLREVSERPLDDAKHEVRTWLRRC